MPSARGPLQGVGTGQPVRAQPAAPALWSRLEYSFSDSLSHLGALADGVGDEICNLLDRDAVAGRKVDHLQLDRVEAQRVVGTQRIERDLQIATATRQWTAALVVNDETRRGYMNLARNVETVFKSLLPDPAASEFGPIRKVFAMIAEKIRCDIPPVDISAVMRWSFAAFSIRAFKLPVL